MAEASKLFPEPEDPTPVDPPAEPEPEDPEEPVVTPTDPVPEQPEEPVVTPTDPIPDEPEDVPPTDGEDDDTQMGEDEDIKNPPIQGPEDGTGEGEEIPQPESQPEQNKPVVEQTPVVTPTDTNNPKTGEASSLAIAATLLAICAGIWYFFKKRK